MKSSERTSRKLIGANFIPPKYSTLAWRLLHQILPTDDKIQRRGVYLASICLLCNKHSESIQHLFLTCSFTQLLWKWHASLFQTTLPSSGSIEDLCQSIMSKPFKSQLYNLWIVTSLSILYEIWRTRNKAKHQGSLVSLHKFQVPIHIFFLLFVQVM